MPPWEGAREKRKRRLALQEEVRPGHPSPEKIQHRAMQTHEIVIRPLHRGDLRHAQAHGAGPGPQAPSAALVSVGLASYQDR